MARYILSEVLKLRIINLEMLKTMSQFSVFDSLVIDTLLVYLHVGCTRGHKAVRDVECYDPDENTWSEVAPLLVPRTGACAVTLEDTIIVIGGTTSKKPSSSCEIYDRNNNKWEYIARKYQTLQVSIIKYLQSGKN